jgi:hypothetical protein
LTIIEVFYTTLFVIATVPTTAASKAEASADCTRKRAPRINGIGRAAEQLGVTRQHLGLVLRGERISPRLLARYHQLRKPQPEEK